MTDDAQRVPWLAAKGKFYFLENRDFALGDVSRELAQLKEAAPEEWRREGMSALWLGLGFVSEVKTKGIEEKGFTNFVS